MSVFDQPTKVRLLSKFTNEKTATLTYRGLSVELPFSILEQLHAVISLKSFTAFLSSGIDLKALLKAVADDMWFQSNVERIKLPESKQIMQTEWDTLEFPKLTADDTEVLIQVTKEQAENAVPEQG